MSVISFPYQIYTHKGKHRPINEDVVRGGVLMKNFSNGIPCKIQYFLLADGMGGLGHGDMASMIVVDTIIDYLKELDYIFEENYRIDSIFQKSIRTAQNKLEDKIQSLKNIDNMGSTLCAVFIVDKMAYMYWVGDSRIYLLRNDSNTSITGIGHRDLNLISKDDSLVWDILEKGTLSLDQIKNHPQSNILTKSMGIGFDGSISHSEINLQEGDLLFLCSDGVLMHLTNKELYDIINDKNAGLTEKTEKIAELTMNRGAKDNFSYILVDCKAEDLSMTAINMQSVPKLKKAFSIKPRDIAIGVFAGVLMLFAWIIYNNKVISLSNSNANEKVESLAPEAPLDTSAQNIETNNIDSGKIVAKMSDTKPMPQRTEDLKKDIKTDLPNKDTESKKITISGEELEILRDEIKKTIDHLGKTMEKTDLNTESDQLRLEALIIDLNVLILDLSQGIEKEYEVEKNKIIQSHNEIKKKYGIK